MSTTISIFSDYSSVNSKIKETLVDLINNQEPILLAVASSVLAHVAYRIHTEGLRADGTALGTYSRAYMKTRRKNNRTEEMKVVASLTRQMENDFTVVAEGNKIGLGFKNSENFKKAGYIEEMYPGTYSTSTEENKIITDTVNQYLSDIFG